jgi:hypothetical protein
MGAVAVALGVGLLCALVGLVITFIQLQSANTALETVTSQLRSERLARAKAEQDAEALSIATTLRGSEPAPAAPVLSPLPAPILPPTTTTPSTP